MEYEYEDISTHPLTEGLAQDMISELSASYGAGTFQSMADKYDYNYQLMFVLRRLEDQNNNIDYIVANNSRDRAVAKMQGPPDFHKRKILDIWLKAVKQMSGLEKVLLGWKKI